MTVTADPVLDIVERTWGFSSLRPLQRQAIDAVLAGRDSLLVVPTGGGKSLCYQAPALLLDGLTVVVSPLLALMKDQVDVLVSGGVDAAALNSMTAVDDQRTIERRALDGSLRLLFVSPERLATASMRALLGRARVRAFAVDEAHCISHWGHDFRPEYRQLRDLRDLFPEASIHAFTATATAQVRADICGELRLREPLVLVGDLDRPNLRYRVVPRGDEVLQVEEVIRRHPNEAGIVYCIRRRDVDAVTAALAARGHRVAAYHAGLTPDERRDAQEAFASERADIIVATVAFGMGIDRSNVRFVVHAGMPKSIEHYQQESGRAGRDGLLSECILLHDPGDAMVWLRILEQSISEEEQLSVAAGQLEAMNRFCMSGVCRHRALVEHFGGTWTPVGTDDRCDACDICLGEWESVEGATVIAQKILSCVVRVGQSFGAAHVAAVLRGEGSSRIRERQHDTLSTFGLLAEHGSSEVRGWIAQLVAAGALVQEGHPRPVLRLGPAARPILRGETEVRLLRTASPAVSDGSEDWAGVDRELFEALRTWRRDVAASRGVAPFVILGDRTLRELAAVRPSSLERLRAIAGIGEVRLREHGTELLQLIDASGLPRDVHVTPRERTKRPTVAKTEATRLLLEGMSIEEVMERTGRARSTVFRDLCAIIEDGTYQPSLRLWMSEETEQAIRRAAAEAGLERLRPIRDITGEAVSYEEIGIVVATMRRQLSAGSSQLSGENRAGLIADS
ncbi:MAG TPA: DNA helicase RecQ [Thermoanaerobaculia bacterium]|nr:DNA helicase RecQ [Thermoanaerobaculia bacterium]